MGKHIDKYRLVNYFDVWGNEEDGYEVNNLCYEEDIIELEVGDHDEIIRKLKDCGFLVPGTKEEQLDIWNDYEMIELYEAARNYPLCRLELIQE